MTHCTMFLRTVSLTSLSFLLFYNFTYYIWFEIHVYKVFPLSIIKEEEFALHRTSSPLVSDPFYRRNRPFDFVSARSTSYSLILDLPSPLSIAFDRSHLGDVRIISPYVSKFYHILYFTTHLAAEERVTCLALF